MHNSHPHSDRNILICLPDGDEECEVIRVLTKDHEVVATTNAALAGAIAGAVPVHAAILHSTVTEDFQSVRRRHGVPVLAVLDSEAMAEQLDESDLAHADDFIVKPFSMVELRRRLSLLVRTPPRQRLATHELPGPEGIVVRPTARELVVGGESIRLRPLECAVLRVLLDHRGEVVGVDTLLNEVWGPERASRNLVEAQISRIRAKLRGTEADGLITTVHGVGYLVR